MADSLNIAINGIAGRMGQQLVAAALARGHSLSGGKEADKSAHIGRTIAELTGQPAATGAVSERLETALAGASVWIDFTVPAATLEALEHIAGRGGIALVIGTTGFSPGEEARIAEAASRLAIVKAGNFSLGVTLLQGLVRRASAALGPEWDIEISETHHRHKKDAPSGTALMLGEAAAEGRGAPLEALRSAPYDGPDAARAPGTIGFSVRRLGGVIGEHEVRFGALQETLSLTHMALDRSVFAHGAIQAAEWVAGRPPGLYSMDDVLGL